MAQLYTPVQEKSFHIINFSTSFHKEKPPKGKCRLLASVGLLRTTMPLSWPWRTGLNSTEHLMKKWILFSKGASAEHQRLGPWSLRKF